MLKQHIDTKKFKKYLIDRDLTQAEIAEHLGMDKSAFGRKIRNIVTFTLPEVIEICNFIGLDNPKELFW